MVKLERKEDFKMPKGQIGAASGEVRNPLGKNQYAKQAGMGEKDESIRVLVPQYLKDDLKAIASQRRTNMTRLILQAVCEKYEIEAPDKSGKQNQECLRIFISPSMKTRLEMMAEQSGLDLSDLALMAIAEKYGID